MKLFKVESLGLWLRFLGLNSHRPSQISIFGGGAPEKTPLAILVPDLKNPRHGGPLVASVYTFKKTNIHLRS